MNIVDQVLSNLPKNDAAAITARDLFTLCKDAETVIQISTILSQLFIKEKICRKSVNLGTTKYAYWYKQNEQNVANKIEEKSPDNEILATAEDPIAKEAQKPKKLFLLENKPEQAPNILAMAINCISNRASERDQPDGERSMTKAVSTFNALTGHKLSEREGWVFMVILKLARSQSGRHQIDDYVDGAAYISLAGESAEAEK